MSYRVRNQDGELRFKTFEELREAYLNHMVGPDDDVLENGSATWRKAGSFPTLVGALDAKPTALQREARWYLLALALLGAGVYFVIYGWGLISFAIVAAIVASFVTWTTVTSFRRRRR
jgi:drug/metabolite transporter (DMT)-like permease